MAIYSMDELLKIILKWEEDLKSFYTLIHPKLDDPAARDMVEMLRRDQEKAVRVVHEINIEEYKKVEFDKNLPNYEREDIFGVIEIDSNALAEEVLGNILDFEKKLLEVFEYLRDQAVYEKATDVFQMLVQYKLGQIKTMNLYFIR